MQKQLAVRAGEAAFVSPKANELVTLLVTDKAGIKRPVQIQRGDLVRRAMAASVSRQVLELVAHHHRTEDGRAVNLALNPQWFQIFADPSTDMRIIAPSQRGKTLYQLVKTFAQLILGMSVGWVMPKNDKVLELVHGKLSRTIKNTPLYRELQAISEGSDNVKFKTFGDFGRLYIVTANSESELTSFSADAMHIDERDFCNKNFLPMYTSRMSFSPYKLTDEISTPTVEGTIARPGQMGVDNIHSEFLLGDQHRFHVPCPYCDFHQILDWYENVVDVGHDDSGRICSFGVRDLEWSPDSAQDIRVCCSQKNCGRPFDRTVPGRWIALNPVGRGGGQKMRTYWVEALNSLVGPNLSTLLERFSKALGNPSKLQTFHNMDLGRTFAGGMMRFTAELFERCQDLQHHMQLSSDGPCTIGIDTNRPWIDMHISKWAEVPGDPEGRRRQVKMWVGKGTYDDDEIIKKIRAFHVVGGVIDNQPETDFAIKLQQKVFEQTGCWLVRCKYATDPNAKPLTVSEAGDNPKLDPPQLITVQKTVAVDDLFQSMHLKSVVWFSEWREALDGALMAEFSNPVRKYEVNEAGNERFIWEGKPDHQLHAAVYDWIAGDILDMKVVKDYSDLGPFINAIRHSHCDPHGSGSAAINSGGQWGGGHHYDDGVMIFRG